MSQSDQQDQYMPLSLVILIPSAFVAVITSVLVICEVTVLNDINSTITTKSNTHGTMNIILRIIIVFCAVFSTLCIWCDLARHCICIIYHKDLYYYPLNNIMGVSDLFYYLAATFFYLVAIIRLQISFLGSKYAIHKSILFILYSLITITFFGSIYYSIIVFLTPKGNTTFWDYYDKIPMIVIGGIDFVLNTSLLILFIIKLNQLLATTLLHCDARKLNHPQSKIYTLTSNLLIVMTRHSILFSFSIVVNQMWYIIVLIQMSYQIELHFTTFCFRALENLSNCIVLLLSFNRNLSSYMYICGCCHKSIQKCFECCIRLQLRKGNKLLYDNTGTSLIPHGSCVIEDHTGPTTFATTSTNTKMQSVTSLDASIQ
eukprot:462406_1